MVLGEKGGGSVIANRVLGGGSKKLTANELLMGEGRWNN